MKIIKKYISNDGISTKYLLGFSRGSEDYKIEALHVRRPEKDIICFSSQVGCSMHCKFCNACKKTAKFSLSCDEMYEQVMTIKIDQQSSNVTLFSCMGEGEPLADGGMQVSALFHRLFLNGERRFALSTSCPSSIDLCKFAIYNRYIRKFIKIQLSLHETRNERRLKLMPKADKISKSLAALETCVDNYLGMKAEVNYTLMDGINDSGLHAKELGLLIGDRFKIKINRFNNNTTNIKRSVNEENFMIVLGTYVDFEYYATDGTDINGACGQFLANEK